MSLIVQKYGGTSMGSPERIREVAKRVARFAREGHRLVVVPSAMSGETNRLLALARELNPDASPRELDVIASTGEQVTIGLLSIALQALGLKAKSYTGWQVPIVTANGPVRQGGRVAGTPMGRLACLAGQVPNRMTLLRF